jgi:hypothetical protein
MSEPANLEIEERKGAIVLKLRGEYAILTPDQAKEIGETLQRYSYHAKYGSDPQTRSMMAEQIRAKMEVRIPHVIRSLTQKKKTPQFIANEIVNVILGEIL